MERWWPFSSSGWTPPAIDIYEIYETKDDLVVTAELPGVQEKDIHLSVAGEVKPREIKIEVG